MRRLPHPARAHPVADLSIDQTREVGANIRFRHKADSETGSNEALNIPPTRVMKECFGPVSW